MTHQLILKILHKIGLNQVNAATIDIIYDLLHKVYMIYFICCDSVYSPADPGGSGNSRSWFTYEELVKATNGFFRSESSG